MSAKIVDMDPIGFTGEVGINEVKELIEWAIKHNIDLNICARPSQTVVCEFILGVIAGVSINKMRKGKLRSSDLDKLYKAATKLTNSRIRVGEVTWDT